MTVFLEFIGSKLLHLFRLIGEVLLLLHRTVISFREAPRNLPAIINQITIIGWETLPVATVMAFFVADSIAASLLALSASLFLGSENASIMALKALVSSSTNARRLF